MNDTIPTAEHLLPCPFCGSEPDMRDAAGSSYVFCKSCDADGPWCGNTKTAAEYWNRRAPSHRQPAQAVALEELPKCSWCNGVGSVGTPGVRCKFCDGSGEDKLSAQWTNLKGTPVTAVLEIIAGNENLAAVRFFGPIPPHGTKLYAAPPSLPDEGAARAKALEEVARLCDAKAAMYDRKSLEPTDEQSIFARMHSSEAMEQLASEIRAMIVAAPAMPSIYTLPESISWAVELIEEAFSDFSEAERAHLETLREAGK